MTKQDRNLAYLMKAVREYNEIATKSQVLELSYNGQILCVESPPCWYGDEEGYLCDFQEIIDFTKVKYSRGCNMILDITDKIKKEGAKL